MKLSTTAENRPGYKKTKIGWIPEEWDIYPFSTLAILSKEKYNPHIEGTVYKCIELEHIQKETGTIAGYIQSNEQSSIKNVFHAGDVLFGKLRPYLRKYVHCTFSGV